MTDKITSPHTDEKKESSSPLITERSGRNTPVDDTKGIIAGRCDTIVKSPLDILPGKENIAFQTGVAEKGTKRYDEVKEVVDRIFAEMYGFISGTKASHLAYLQHNGIIVGGVGVTKLEDKLSVILPELLFEITESNMPLIQDYFTNRSAYVEFGSTAIEREYRKNNIPLLFLSAIQAGIEMGATRGIGIFNILIRRLMRKMGGTMEILSSINLMNPRTQESLKTQLSLTDPEIQAWHKQYFGKLSPSIIGIDLLQSYNAFSSYISSSLS